MSTGIWAWWIWARKVSARSQGEDGGLTTYTKLVALEGIFPSPATTCDGSVCRPLTRRDEIQSS